MIQFYNSLTRKKEEFKPLKEGKVAMYNCGPTVYNYITIGNLRSFLLADLLRRFLDNSGYEVSQVMNITDVGHALADADIGEDKLEVSAKKEGKTPLEIADFYTTAFFKDIDRINIHRAHVYSKATDHIPEMIAMIQKLLDNDHAYKVNNDIYYDVSSFPGYGQLSGNKIENLNPGARIEVRQEKKNPADFALWIFNPNHVLQWEAPWGAGYPGWHIECSAMATKYLGETIDIHTGGEDNKFPHHECEIAQSEGASGKKFVNYWLHATHLLVEGQKMAKSAGNFYTLDDLLQKGYEARVIRLFLLSVHYRQQLNFTFPALEAMENGLKRIDGAVGAVRRCETVSIPPAPLEVSDKAARIASAKGGIGDGFAQKFMAELADDLNISAALAVVYEVVGVVNEKMTAKSLTADEKQAAIEFFDLAGEVLGISFDEIEKSAENMPANVKVLVDERQIARQEKHFSESDRLRDEIKALGYEVEDTPIGPVVKRI